MTQHDVIAFLSAWADNTTPREAAAYVHFGMTSSDLLDTAIAIRTAVIKDGQLHVQAGAGVVADSVPHSEWVETMNKARAMMNAAAEAAS